MNTRHLQGKERKGKERKGRGGGKEMRKKGKEKEKVRK